MSNASPDSPPATQIPDVTIAMPADPRRWAALAVIAVSTLMVVLDSSIITIALPSAQADLGISDAERQWAVTAYALAFGGLLLFGGRLADVIGRKRIFLVGVLGFAVASAVGGFAVDPGMLFGARALQGAFAALLAPAGLSLILVTFPDARERAKAFGVYGAVQGAGGAVGLILGGLLTEYLDWRWTLLVNVPIAIAVLFAAVANLRESRADGNRSFDIPGSILVTGGLAALVYAFTLAATDGVGWSAPPTISLLAAGVIALVAFVLLEAHSSNPLLPLRVVLDRNRGGALLASLLIFSGMFGLFLFLTYYFQINLHYTPLRAGLAFLPFSAGIIVTAAVASSLLPRLGARKLLIAGTILSIAGLLWLTLINEESTFATGVLPMEIVMGIGIGLALVPLSIVATQGIGTDDAGVGGAMLNVTQQVGGALGTALLNTIYVSAFAAYLSEHPDTPQASLAPYLHGYQAAYIAGALLIAAALGAVIVFITGKRTP